MKKLMNRAGLIAAAFALALAVALALNAAGQTPAVAQAPSAICADKSYDVDGNGLIDICTPEQLYAMRWDLDGNGLVSGTNASAYHDLFHCGSESCKGYELKSDISIDDLPSNKPWTAIGPWGAVFDGNRFSITGLKGQHGLFSAIGVTGSNAADINAATVVRDVNVVDADITLCGGALATINRATIIGSYVTGKITCSATAFGSIGGLVAANRGTIIASVADVEVKLTNIPADSYVRVGGFAGMNYGIIRRSYAYGDVIDARDAGVRNAHPRRNNRGFKAFGFANNHEVHGKIYSSFSYGNKSITNVSSESDNPATFASGGLNSDSNSCELDRQWKFTFAQSKCATDD